MPALTYFQKGFNYSQDGAGNRLVYHLQGCNLACPWCSNPEGMDAAAAGAREISPEDLAAEARSCRPMFFDGGGVTFTGGEATLQFDALRAALELLRADGIHVAVETNGTSPRLPEIFSLVDELIMDCKHVDGAAHRAAAGADNAAVLANLAAAFARHGNVLVRIPLVNGFNAEEADAARFADWFAANGGATRGARFEILPYHEYGKDKWARCGKAYAVRDGFVTDARRAFFEETLRARGLRVVRT